MSTVLAPWLIDRLGWILLHSVWQGALIALAAATLRLLAPESAQWRYTVSVTALALMLLVPVLTFVLSVSAGAGVPAITIAAGNATMPAVVASSPAAPALPWSELIVLAWLAGVAVCLARLVAGWLATRRLLAAATTLPEPAWYPELCRRLRLTRPVRLLLSAHTSVPVVVDWLRPAVLLPLAAITGLTPAQLEAVVAHELAHVRRHDFIVNLMQRCVEALLFFHPAAWWLSAAVRADREECCDDAAMTACGDGAVLASALVELESQRVVAPGMAPGALAIAATGGRLTRRVQRILGITPGRRDVRDVVAAIALTGLLLTIGACQGGSLRAQPAAPDTPASLTQPARAASLPWVLFHAGRTIAHADSADAAAAGAAHERLGGDLVWFRQAGVSYYARDPELLQQLADMQAPLASFADQFEQMEAQQEALLLYQRLLARETRSVQVADLGPAMQALQADLVRLASTLAPVADSTRDLAQRDLAQLQRELAGVQRAISRLQEEHVHEQRQIERLERERAERQREIARQQAAVARQQAEIARQSDQAVRSLLLRAVETGTAIRL
jgi:beta-lactamase regulating signal transducer with metallopeptidase domain